MRDRMGNELEIGQLVTIDIGAKGVQGKIIKLEQGGLALSGMKNVVTPDVIHLYVTVTCTQPPGKPQPSVIRLVNPETEVIVPKTRLKVV